MMKFENFAELISTQITLMSQYQLYTVDIDSDLIWNTYLNLIPDNHIFKTNRQYDCKCCNSFIRNMGNVIAIINGEVVSIWDIKSEYDNQFDDMCKELSRMIKTKDIISVYKNNTESNKIGNKSTKQLIVINDNGTEKSHVHVWGHLHCKLPKEYKTISTDKIAKYNNSVGVFKRGLEEFRIDDIDAVLKLIDNNELLRGAEHKANIIKFKNYILQYNELLDREKHIFLWSNVKDHVISLRNSVIGTLFSDLSADMGFDRAIESFESKVDPTNYARKKSLKMTQALKDKAMKLFDELEITQSIYRCYANLSDVSINDILYVDNDKSHLLKSHIEQIFDKGISGNSNVKYNDEMDIEEFISNVLPKINKLSLYVSNDHVRNLVSITGPKNINSNPIFKWNNRFAWSYINELTDSIREKVRKKGGNVHGKLRMSLYWKNTSDYDIHVVEPNNNHIYYQNMCGKLDVDENANGSNLTRDAVENVTINDLQIGNYRVFVNNFNQRELSNPEFIIEVEIDGHITRYNYNKVINTDENVNVVDLICDGNTITDQKIYPNINKGTLSTDIWNIKTQQYIDVDTVMLSPNFWHGETIGNKHWFFILKECLNPDDTRGFYNEFLMNELHDIKKATEYLGEQIKCPYTDNQLSGLGFSSTIKNSVIAKINNKQNIKINF